MDFLKLCVSTILPIIFYTLLIIFLVFKIKKMSCKDESKEIRKSLKKEKIEKVLFKGILVVIGIAVIWIGIGIMSGIITLGIAIVTLGGVLLYPVAGSVEWLAIFPNLAVFILNNSLIVLTILFYIGVFILFIREIYIDNQISKTLQEKSKNSEKDE